MDCPYYNSPKNHRVVESREVSQHVRRRRQRLKCKRNFSTRETLSEITGAKLLKEDRRSANKSFRLLAEQNAALWTNQNMMLNLIRRVLRHLGADDELNSLLAPLLTRPQTRRRTR